MNGQTDRLVKTEPRPAKSQHQPASQSPALATQGNLATLLPPSRDGDNNCRQTKTRCTRASGPSCGPAASARISGDEGTEGEGEGATGEDDQTEVVVLVPTGKEKDGQAEGVVSSRPRVEGGGTLSLTLKKAGMQMAARLERLGTARWHLHWLPPVYSDILPVVYWQRLSTKLNYVLPDPSFCKFNFSNNPSTQKSKDPASIYRARQPGSKRENAERRRTIVHADLAPTTRRRGKMIRRMRVGPSGTAATRKPGAARRPKTL